MKTVDFRKIEVENIEGGKDYADVSKQLGNQMYMQGTNIEECELGRDIYHNGEVVMGDRQVEMVRKFITVWAYVMRTAVENALSNRE